MSLPSQIRDLVPARFEEWLGLQMDGRRKSIGASLSCSPCAEASARGLEKCCRFWPFVPNFSMGSILKGSSDREVFMQSLRERGALVSPLGVNAPGGYQDRFRAGRWEIGPQGHCPFFVSLTGACGIWSNRPAECALYYCRSLGGAVGGAEARDVLTNLEQSIAALVLLEFGYSWPEVETLLETQVEVSMDGDATAKSVAARAWSWRSDSVIEFYLGAQELFERKRFEWRDLHGNLFDSVRTSTLERW